MKYTRIIIALCLVLCLLCGCGEDTDGGSAEPAASPVCLSGNLANGGLAADSGIFTYFINSEEGTDFDGMIASFWSLARTSDDGETETICGASGGINISGKYVYFFVNMWDTTGGMSPGIYRIEHKYPTPQLIWAPDSGESFIFRQLVLHGDTLYFCTSDAVMSVGTDGQNFTTIAYGDCAFDFLNVTDDGTIWYTVDVNYSGNSVLYKADGEGPAVPVELTGKNPTGIIVCDGYIYYCCEEGETSCIRRQSIDSGENKALISSEQYPHFNLYDGRLWYSFYDDGGILRSCDPDAPDLDITDHSDAITEVYTSASRMCFASGNIYYVPSGTQLDTVECIPVPEVKQSAPTTTVTTTAVPLTTTTTTAAPTTTTAAVTAAPRFLYASASSTLDGQSGKNYYASNLIDGTTSTTWCENVNGVGVGEWIMLEAESEQTLSGIRVANGYWGGGELYTKNGRVTSVKLSFSDGTSMNLDMPSYSAEGTWDTLEFAAPVRTSYIRIEILSAVAGSKYSDTCISEIEVF